jgi:hypothetical protein
MATLEAEKYIRLEDQSVDADPYRKAWGRAVCGAMLGASAMLIACQMIADNLPVSIQDVQRVAQVGNDQSRLENLVNIKQANTNNRLHMPSFRTPWSPHPLASSSQHQSVQKFAPGMQVVTRQSIQANAEKKAPVAVEDFEEVTPSSAESLTTSFSGVQRSLLKDTPLEQCSKDGHCHEEVLDGEVPFVCVEQSPDELPQLLDKDVQKRLQKFKVGELREKLLQYGLSTDGKKAELVERLAQRETKPIVGSTCLDAWTWAAAVVQDPADTKGLSLICGKTNADVRGFYQAQMDSPSFDIATWYTAKQALNKIDEACV